MNFNEILYAGHSALFLYSGDHVIGIDTWLDENPSCPRELINPPKLDLLVLTHGHSDHAGDAVRLHMATKCRVAATFELATLLSEEGIPSSEIVFLNKGGGFDFHGARITLTNAFHSSSFKTREGSKYAGEPCGVVIQGDNVSIYHAGDTCLFSDMTLIGERYQPSVVLLPIGDTFTMGPEDAAFAASLIKGKLNIPIHHSTFSALTGRPEDFVRACERRGLKSEVLEPGQKRSLTEI
jgi:L-ascorbate metabolism protein UlaG (beta-lactamase superfamily)